MVTQGKIAWLLALLILGCSKDETLMLPKRPYTGDEIKINGIYCSIDSSYGSVHTFFLYRDGTILKGDAFNLSQFEEKLDYMSTQEWNLGIKKYRHRWGHFTVEGTRFTWESWVPPSGGGFPTYVYEGTILNDTTIAMERNRHSRSGKWNPFVYTYRLHQIRSKPDSLNRFTN